MSNKRGSSSSTRKEGTFSCLAARKMLIGDYLHLLYDYQERIELYAIKGVGINNCRVSVECSEINRSQWKTQYYHLFSYRSLWLYSVNRIVLSRSKYNWTQFTSLAINQFYKNMEHLIEYKVLKPTYKTHHSNANLIFRKNVNKRNLLRLFENYSPAWQWW